MHLFEALGGTLERSSIEIIQARNFQAFKMRRLTA